ncbi:phosphatase PAP2 family protein [Isoptericola sp. NPDC019482]|uniref:phosphatase PAP2 family protein n=1 Tax=Isoptericola sp. NPDC019482 TaxID=3154688 RepID=UPI00348AD884
MSGVSGHDGHMPRVHPRTTPAGRAVLMVGLPAAAALALVYLLGVRTRVGQLFDDRVFGWFVGLGPSAHALAPLLRTGVPLFLGAAAGVLGLLAIRQRRWRAAIGSVLLVALSVVASLTLRDSVLTRPDLGVPGYADNTLPSSHATITVALCAAVLVLWPAQRRRPPTATVVAALTLTVLAAASSVVSWAHRPTDVVASALLVLAAGPVVMCLLEAARRPAGRRT